MAMTINAKDFMNQNIYAAENEKKTVSGNSVFAGDTRIPSLLQQKKDAARKQAMKLVSDAFEKDRKLDDQQQEIRDKIKALSDENGEYAREIVENDAAVQKLSEKYGIDPDSEEQKDLEILHKRYLARSGERVEFTLEDLKKAAEIEAKGLTEYQSRAVEYYKQNEELYRRLNENKALMMGNASALGDMKRERLKDRSMLDAWKQADAVMEAASEDIKGMAVQGGIEHLDQEMEEKKEKAKEQEEKKEEQEEKLEAVREEKARIEEMVYKTRAESEESREETKRIKDTVSDILEGAHDLEQVSNKLESGTAQGQANSEIQNILNKLSLLEEDIKGAKIDTKIS